MLTVKEAMQRATLYGVRIRRADAGSTEWRVTLVDWTREQSERRAYFTDDLEDAVITGSKMRQFAMFSRQ